MDTIATEKLDYLSGFGNEHASEAVPGALPRGQNSPQRAPLGLYAEQLCGTAFTAPRAAEPPVLALSHPPVGDAPAVPPDRQRRAAHGAVRRGRAAAEPAALEPAAAARRADRFRRRPVHASAATATPARARGIGVHLYAANRSMDDRVFYDADGELLIVPQQGAAAARAPSSARSTWRPARSRVMPRGVVPRRAASTAARAAMSARTTARRSACPSSGPIGSNGLANPRDFLSPVAAYEDRERPTRAGPPSSAAICGRPSSTTRRSTSSPGTATTRRTNTTSRASTPSARSASTIRTRRSSPC